jgi:hypothetical protein
MPPFAPNVTLPDAPKETQMEMLVNGLYEFLSRQDGSIAVIVGKVNGTLQDIQDGLVNLKTAVTLSNDKEKKEFDLFIVILEMIFTEILLHERVEMSITARAFFVKGREPLYFDLHCNGSCDQEKKKEEFEIQCLKCELDYCKDCAAAWQKDNALFIMDPHCISLLGK